MSARPGFMRVHAIERTLNSQVICFALSSITRCSHPQLELSILPSCIYHPQRQYHALRLGSLLLHQTVTQDALPQMLIPACSRRVYTCRDDAKICGGGHLQGRRVDQNPFPPDFRGDSPEIDTEECQWCRKHGCSYCPEFGGGENDGIRDNEVSDSLATGQCRLQVPSIDQ